MCNDASKGQGLAEYGAALLFVLVAGLLVLQLFGFSVLTQLSSITAKLSDTTKEEIIVDDGGITPPIENVGDEENPVVLLDAVRHGNNVSLTVTLPTGKGGSNIYIYDSQSGTTVINNTTCGNTADNTCKLMISVLKGSGTLIVSSDSLSGVTANINYDPKK